LSALPASGRPPSVVIFNARKNGACASMGTFFCRSCAATGATTGEVPASVVVVAVGGISRYLPAPRRNVNSDTVPSTVTNAALRKPALPMRSMTTAGVSANGWFFTWSLVV